MLSSRKSQIPIHRHLALVPEPHPGLGAWVPTGRTLHLNDVENLIGGPNASDAEWRHAAEQYRCLARVGPHDHVISACNPGLILKANAMWLPSRWLTRKGPNGADLALLDAVDPHEVARRYHRVVIGSGDNAFADLALDLRRFGVEVHVIGRTRSIARSLANSAQVVGLIHPQLGQSDAAETLNDDPAPYRDAA